MRERILLVMGPFYGYENAIREQLNDMGYDVTFVDYFGSFRRFKMHFLLGNRLAHKAYRRHIAKSLQSLDLSLFNKMLVIRGTTLTIEDMEYVKMKNPLIKTILYQWDSVRIYDYRKLASGFDRVVTFEKEDAQKYGYEYLPLFNDKSDIVTNSDHDDIDVLLLGVYRSDRYEAAIRMANKCKKNGLKFYSHLYIPFSELLKELRKGNMINMSICKTYKLNKEQVNRLYQRSHAFMDVVYPNQKGLSMRTIECYCMNKILLTNNLDSVKGTPLLNDMKSYPLGLEIDDLKKICTEKIPPYSNKEEFGIRKFLMNLLSE